MSIATVLQIFDEVPAFDKEMGDIKRSWSMNGHVNIMPRHPADQERALLIGHVVIYVVKVLHTGIVVILSRKNCIVQHSFQMYVGKRMGLSIPAAVANIQSSDARGFIVDADDFRVMAPEVRLLATEVIRMSEYLNVLV